MAKKCTKKCVARANFFGKLYLLIMITFSLPSLCSIRCFLLIYNYINQRLNLFSIYLNSGWCFLHALIGYSISEYPALFTDSPPFPQNERHQTHVSCEQNAFLVCCHDKQRNFTTKKQAVPEIHEEGDKVRFGSYNR